MSLNLTSFLCKSHSCSQILTIIKRLKLTAVTICLVCYTRDYNTVMHQFARWNERRILCSCPLFNLSLYIPSIVFSDIPQL